MRNAFQNCMEHDKHTPNTGTDDRATEQQREDKKMLLDMDTCIIVEIVALIAAPHNHFAHVARAIASDTENGARNSKFAYVIKSEL